MSIAEELHKTRDKLSEGQQKLLETARQLLDGDDLDSLLARLENNSFPYAEHVLFVRRAKLTRFPYHVFYAIDEVNLFVEIIGSRDRGIIRRRINF